jgi:hypothetical protein
MSVVQVALARPGRAAARRKRGCRPRRWKVVVGVLVLAAAAVGAAGWALGDNFATVLPGRVYRSAQLSAAGLHDRIARLHLRAVLNLRGANPGEDWYDEECELAAHEGVKHYDLATDSEYPPTPEDLHELIGVLDHCERPLLIHCQSGIDRTGVAAAVCVLLGEGGSPALAHGQLGQLYGHQLPWRERTARQEAFLGQYDRWLADQGCAHSPGRFRRWALRVYGAPSELAQNATASPRPQ